MFDDAGFTLTSEEPQPQALSLFATPPAKARQRVLFAGLDCLPGQLDLFATDGEATNEEIPCSK